MSRESKFHKLIEKQNTEEKEAFWKKLESRLESERDIDNVECGGEVLVMSKSRTNTTRRNLLIVVAVFMALALAICLTFFIVKPFDKTAGEDSKNEIEKPDDKRYCTVNDYSTEISKITIKQYAADKNLELLYFDCYEESEYYADTQYILKETREVICLFEEIYDSNYADINLYVTDDRTEVDVTKPFDNYCIKDTVINSVKIKYNIEPEKSCAKFTYKGHRYYLSVEDAPEDGYILGLVETLLN